MIEFLDTGAFKPPKAGLSYKAVSSLVQASRAASAPLAAAGVPVPFVVGIAAACSLVAAALGAIVSRRFAAAREDAPALI